MKHGARPLRSTRRLQNLTGTRPAWYRITNQADGPALVSIYDEIGFFGVSAGDFLAELQAISGDVEMHLNSPGGDVFDGIAIYNTLKQRKGTVAVIVDGLAASAASFIAQAASPGHLEMAPHSRMMIHDGFAMGIGNAADLRELADQLDMVSDEIASIYAERTGKPVAHWREQMKAETWLSDQEAVDAGLADKIHGQDAPESQWDLSVYARANGEPRAKGVPDIFMADKYSDDDRKEMAKSGEAMEDGSYPIRDAEDLDNAIHAVGRGGADHDAIRRHIIKRAEALGRSSEIPDNWGSDGSLQDMAASALVALLTSGLKGGQA